MADPPAPPHAPSLDLSLHPDDAARLPRLGELARLRAGRARSVPWQIIWHDTPDGALAAEGLALAEQRAGRERIWQLERLRGTPGAPWPPGTTAPVLEQAAQPGDLSRPLPAPLLPVAAFAGTLRTLPLAAAAGGIGLTMLEGALRAVTDARPLCRVRLHGPGGPVTDLALALARHVRLSVPGMALAAEAYGIAGRTVPPLALGAPLLPTRLPVGAAFAAVAAHLTAVLLHWAPHAGATAGPEPVHQMRVALRRLRSALSLFRRAIGPQALAEVEADLRSLQAVLGPARDWDVFCAGIGRAVAEALPEDRAVARLLAAAERQRQDAYAALAAFLDGSGYRLLGIRLACLAAFRPWDALPPPAEPAADPADADAVAAEKRAAALAAPLADFAGHALSRRLDRLAAAGEDLASLSLADLHGLRIQGKRLRYAAEFFAPLYPPRETRKFLRRISALQERLGHLNDGAVAAGLMARLGAGGAERSYAVGVVRGFVAARHAGTRSKVDRSWRKFRRLEPFWL